MAEMRDRHESLPKRRNQGFTLVEVLVATVLFLVACLALAHLAVVTSQLQRSEGERRLAWTALSQQLRMVESTPFAQIAAVHDGRPFDVVIEGATNGALPPLVGDADGLPGLIEVTPVTIGGKGNMMVEVTARIDWDGSFAPQSLVRRVQITRSGANP
jgi:prepilin-type N-terminal cleavage/methylation domain-containing protein